MTPEEFKKAAKELFKEVYVPELKEYIDIRVRDELRINMDTIVKQVLEERRRSVAVRLEAAEADLARTTERMKELQSWLTANGAP